MWIELVIEATNRKTQYKSHWIDAGVKVFEDLTQKPPGCKLPRTLWTSMNIIRTTYSTNVV